MSKNTRKFKKYWTFIGVFLMTSQLGLANEAAECSKSGGSWFKFWNNTGQGDIEMTHTYPASPRYSHIARPEEVRKGTFAEGDWSQGSCCKLNTKIYLKHSCTADGGSHVYSSTQEQDCPNSGGYGTQSVLTAFSQDNKPIRRGSTMGCPDLHIRISESR